MRLSGSNYRRKNAKTFWKTILEIYITKWGEKYPDLFFGSTAPGFLHSTSLLVLVLCYSTVQFLVPSFLKSASIPSSHLSLCLPLFCCPFECGIIIFLFVSLLCIWVSCHAHLILTNFISWSLVVLYKFHKALD